MNIFEASVMLLAEVAATVLIVWGVFGYDIKWGKKKALPLALAVAATIGMAAVDVYKRQLLHLPICNITSLLCL